MYDAAAATRTGEIERPPDWWSPIFNRGQRGVRFFTAVHTSRDGRPDAFARYALDQSWPDGVPEMTLRVIEVQAVDADAEAALWSYLFGIDLVGTVRAVDRPVDDPLRWRLADPRRLRVREVARSPVGAPRRRRRGARRPHLRHGGRSGDRARRCVPPRQQRPVADRRWTRRCHVPRRPASRPTSPSPHRSSVRCTSAASRRRRSPRRGASRAVRGRAAPGRPLLRRAPVTVVHHALLSEPRPLTIRVLDRMRSMRAHDRRGDQPMAALSCMMASIGPGSTSLSSAR